MKIYTKQRKRRIVWIMTIIFAISIILNLVAMASSSDRTVVSLVPLLDLKKNTIVVIPMTRTDNKSNRFVEAQAFNTQDFRTNANNEPYTYNPKDASRGGVVLSYSDFLPSYLRDPNIILTSGSLDKSEFYSINDRSSGLEKEDRDIVDGRIDSTSDGSFMPFSLPSKPLGNIDNSASQEESTRASYMATTQTTSFSQLFNKLDVDDSSFLDAVSQFAQIDGNKGIISVNNLKYSIRFGNPKGVMFNKDDAEQARENKQNYVYDFDENNNLMMHVWEGTDSIENVLYGDLLATIGAIPKGYQEVNGETYLNRLNDKYTDDSYYIDLRMSANYAMSLYKAKNIYQGNTVNLITDKTVEENISFKVAGWINSFTASVSLDADYFIHYEYINNSYFQNFIAMLGVYLLIITSITAIPIFIIEVLKLNKTSKGNSNLRQTIMTRIMNVVYYILTMALLMPIFYGSLKASSWLSELFIALFGRPDIVAGSASTISGAFGELFMVLVYDVVLLFSLGMLVDSLYEILVTPYSSTKKTITGDLGFLDLEPIFTIIGNQTATALLGLLVSVSYSIANAIAIPLILVPVAFLFIVLLGVKKIEKKLEIGISSVFGTAMKAGGIGASVMAVGAGLASRGMKSVGNSGDSEGSSSRSRSSGSTALEDDNSSSAGDGHTSRLNSNSASIKDAVADNDEKQSIGQKIGSQFKEYTGQVGTNAKNKIKDTASQFVEDKANEFSNRGGGNGNMFADAVASVGMAGSALGKGGKAVARQSANMLDVTSHGLKASANLMQGNIAGAGDNIHKAIDNGSAMVGAGVETARSGMNYMNDAYATGQSQRLLDKTNGVLDRKITGAGDGMFHTDTVSGEAYKQQGVTNIESGEKGQFDMSYDWNNSSPEIKEQLGRALNIMNEDCGVDRLKEMGITGIKAEPIYDNNNNVVNNKMTMTMNKDALSHMGLNTLKVNKDGNVDAGYNVKTFGGQPRQYVPNIKKHFDTRSSQLQEPQAN